MSLAGLTQRQISNRFGCSHITISRLLEQTEATGVVLWFGRHNRFYQKPCRHHQRLTQRKTFPELRSLLHMWYPFQQHHIHTFQQDNARPHSARICLPYLHEHNITVLPLPTPSSDLSPIKHLWDILGSRLKAGKPQKIDRLSEVLVEERNWIRQETIQKVINSIGSRVDGVINADSGHTQYYPAILE